jgi:hypothetical protein
VDQPVARAEQTARVRIARDELRQMRELSRTIDALEAEIAGLVDQVAPQLLAEPGNAIRCLKRHLVRRIWHLLQPATPATPIPAPSTLLTYRRPVFRRRVLAPRYPRSAPTGAPRESQRYPA